MVPFIWKNCKYPRCAERALNWQDQSWTLLCDWEWFLFGVFPEILALFYPMVFESLQEIISKNKKPNSKRNCGLFKWLHGEKDSMVVFVLQLLSLDKHDCQIHLVYNYTLWMPIWYSSRRVYPLVHTYLETYLKSKMLL